MRLNILIVEDSEADTKMLLYELKRGGYDPVHRRVESAAEMRAALDMQNWDVIISDYSMPDFDGLSALHILMENQIDIPFIIVSGSVGEDTAVQAMKTGAHDYLMKDNLSRLVPAIERELREAENRRDRREAENALHRANEDLERRVQERTAELDETNKLLQQAVHARDEFISVAAHELKTPLTSIRGFAQRLVRQMDKNDGMDLVKMRHSLQIIDEQSAKLAQLISQLMDVGRIESGHLTLNRELVDIVTIAKNIVNLAQMTTTHHLITMGGDSSIFAKVDQVRIEQVFSNLLNNAVKYSPSGGAIDVNVSLYNENMIQIKVLDHGVGIPPEHRSHIFERFYQAHGSGYEGGIGVGLFISNQIVLLHHGQITVEFPAEGGTCFIVELPVNTEEDVDYKDA